MTKSRSLWAAGAMRTASDEKERKRLYLEDRKEEAALMSSALQDRMAELESVLVASVRSRLDVIFASLRQTVTYRKFDAGGLERSTPAPRWEQYAPPPPVGLGRLFGGSGRQERQEALARTAFDQACAEHAATEADRRRRLAERRREYHCQVTAATDATAAHNAEIDQFEHDFRAGESEAVAQFCTLVLDSVAYPDGFPHRTRVLYRPEPKEVLAEFELPPQSLIPVERGYKYIAVRDEITATARPTPEIKGRYARLIAQVALRTIHEVFTCDQADVVSVVTFNGHVSTKDLATGQPARPCLVSVSAERQVFSSPHG